MRLYQLGSAHYALQNVEQRQLKISRIDDLNDPFELLGAMQRDKDWRRAFAQAKNQIHTKDGVLCFSRSWRNPVLWSHYGDKHRGICLGFDVDDNVTIPVSYAADLLRLKLDKAKLHEPFSKQVANQLLTTKFKDWAYEEEVRILASLAKARCNDGLYFYSFAPNLVLREVILGPRCDTSIDEVRSLVQSFDPHVHVLKGRLAFQKYGVVEDRRYRPGARLIAAGAAASGRRGEV